MTTYTMTTTYTTTMATATMSTVVLMNGDSAHTIEYVTAVVPTGSAVSGETVGTEGELYVLGVAENTEVASGGKLDVAAGGLVEGVRVESGGTLVVEPKARVLGELTFDQGSVLELAAGDGSSGGNVLYLGEAIRNVDVLKVDVAATWTLAISRFTTSAGPQIQTLANDGDISFVGEPLLLVSVTGTGTVHIGDDQQAEVSSSVDAGETFAFDGSGGTLSIDDPASFAGTLAGFEPSDTLFLYSVTPDANNDIKFIHKDGTQELEITLSNGDTLDLRLDPNQNFSGKTFHIASDGLGNSNVTEDTNPCYCSGTRLLTVAGEVAVEALKVGDVAVTASGERRPIRWIGHRALDLRAHREPKSVTPVRVSAGAFGEGLPRRDLWLSPGHSVFVDGVLVPIRYLVNGATIAQVPVERVTYWHVELATHDVLVAEGLPAESYLDTGNRTAFVGGGAFLELHPDFEPKHATATCAPLRKAGPEVVAVRSRLLARAQALGHTLTNDTGLHLLIDGRSLAPKPLGGLRFEFALPPSFAEARLASRVWVPAQLLPDSGDGRTLGVRVERLAADGADLALDDCDEGWQPVDRRSPGRWTKGSARLVLPAGARRLLVQLGGRRMYWADAAVPAAVRAAG